MLHDSKTSYYRHIKGCIKNIHPSKLNRMSNINELHALDTRIIKLECENKILQIIGDVKLQAEQEKFEIKSQADK